MIKRIRIKYIIMLIISIMIMVFTYNNYFLYKTPIVKITSIKNIYDENQENEIIKQQITGKIMNGDDKGTKVSFENETSISGVFDEQLHKRSEVFIKMNGINNSSLEVIGVKRDKYMVILLVLLINLIIIVGGKKGIKSIIALTINATLSIFLIYCYINNIISIELLPLFIILSIIFILFSLLICYGWNKKTLVAILSSILSVFISFLIAYLVLNHYKETINYWSVDYIEAIRDYEGIFYINILLCGLGAVMDISITMSSSLKEIIEKSPNISRKDLKKSGQQISKDILGTMINVMLFTCYVSIIPIVVLASRNYMSIANAISSYGQIEMIRILTSCISIVISIPVALYVSLFIYKRGEKS